MSEALYYFWLELLETVLLFVRLCRFCERKKLTPSDSLAIMPGGMYPSREHSGNIDDSLMLSSITSVLHQLYIEHHKHWWIFDVTSMLHPCFQCFPTCLQSIINICIEITNVSSMLRWCWIVVSLLNRPVFLMTTLMNHQCYQCVLNWGSWNNNSYYCYMFKVRC